MHICLFASVGVWTSRQILTCTAGLVISYTGTLGVCLNVSTSTDPQSMIVTLASSASSVSASIYVVAIAVLAVLVQIMAL